MPSLFCAWVGWRPIVQWVVIKVMAFDVDLMTIWRTGCTDCSDDFATERGLGDSVSCGASRGFCGAFVILAGAVRVLLGRLSRALGRLAAVLL